VASDREAAKAVGRTTIATATLEGLIVENALFEKYAKVVEDRSVILFRVEVGAIWQTAADGTDLSWLGYTVHIESRSRIVKQTGPHKDWRNILDKALTIWIEGDTDNIDPL